MSADVVDLRELQAIAKALRVEPRSDMFAMLDEALDGFLARYRASRGEDGSALDLAALMAELRSIEALGRGMRWLIEWELAAP